MTDLSFGNPTVSVIMLTYNREQYVGRAIESILCQTFDGFEFVVVDNGSEDNGGNICDDYAKRDKRIRVIHKKRGNIGSGRNAGLLASRGKYIAFIDDDDVAELDMLSFLYNLITEYQADISICGSWRSTEGVLTRKYVYDRMLELNAEQAIVELLKRDFYNITFPCKMIRRELMLPPPFSEEGRYDDINTAYKVFAEARKVVVQGVPKYTFYRHEKNNSAFSIKHWLLKPDILDEYLHAYRERTVYLSKKLPSIADYVRYSEWSFMISILEKINRLEIAGCNRQLEVMTQELKAHKDEFLGCGYILDIEKKWMATYT